MPKRVDELDKSQLVKVVERVQQALWPGGDADHSWSADTLDEVSRALGIAGLGPDAEREPHGE